MTHRPISLTSLTGPWWRGSPAGPLPRPPTKRKWASMPPGSPPGPLLMARLTGVTRLPTNPRPPGPVEPLALVQFTRTRPLRPSSGAGARVAPGIASPGPRPSGRPIAQYPWHPRPDQGQSPRYRRPGTTAWGATTAAPRSTTRSITITPTTRTQRATRASGGALVAPRAWAS